VISHSFAFRASRRLNFSYKSIENACTAFPSTLVSRLDLSSTTTRTSPTPRRRTVTSKYSSYTFNTNILPKPISRYVPVLTLCTHMREIQSDRILRTHIHKHSLRKDDKQFQKQKATDCKCGTVAPHLSCGRQLLARIQSV
jgi:hypothetical protein